MCVDDFNTLTGPICKHFAQVDQAEDKSWS